MNIRVKSFFNNLQTADIIALLLTIGVLASNFANIRQQFMVPQALLLIIGYYFAKKTIQ